MAQAVAGDLPQLPADDHHPHGVRRAALLAGTAVGVLVVALAIGAVTVMANDDSGQARKPATARVTPSANAAASSPTSDPFATFATGATVDPGTFVGHLHDVIAARGAIAGAEVVANHSATNPDTGQTFNFAVAPTGEYRIEYAGHVAYSRNGRLVTIDPARQQILIAQPPASPVNTTTEALTPNDVVNRVLYPDQWLQSMITGNTLTVTYKGTDQVNGRSTWHFNLGFGPDAVKYSAVGWDLDIDAATGALVHHFVHYSDAIGGGGEEGTLRGLSGTAPKLAAADLTMPGGCKVTGALAQPDGSTLILADTSKAGESLDALVSRASASATIAPAPAAG